MDSTASILEASLTSTLLFRVGAVLYGCDIRCSQEIVPYVAATRLPGAPAHVLGLINVRGTVVTVVDLGVRLDSTATPSTEGSILLVRHRDRWAGVLVDEVVDVRALDVDESRSEAGGIVRGVATIEAGAVAVLDLHAVIRQVLLS